MSEDAKVMQVLNYVSCDEKRIREVLEACEWNVLEAIDTLTSIPATSGQKYVPPAPVIDDGLTPEVREKLQTARKLADLLSAAPQNDLRGTVTQTSSASVTE
jgi:hypothetical protein